MVSTRTEGVVAATAKATAVDRNGGIVELVDWYFVIRIQQQLYLLTCCCLTSSVNIHCYR